MMNLLKAKTKISCDTCGCSMSRSKTIKVEANSKEEAIKEGNEKFAKWQASFRGSNCAVCASILKSMN